MLNTNSYEDKTTFENLPIPALPGLVQRPQSASDTQHNNQCSAAMEKFQTVFRSSKQKIE